MKVIITGASGMVGGLVLDHCLSESKIIRIISLVRKPSSISHPKLKEFVIEDFTNYSNVREHFASIDTAFFCLGVYTGSVDKETFRQITVDYPVALAKELHSESPLARFCLLSGSGADRSEKSKMTFAKYKGIAENNLAAIGFQSFHTFRPAYIYPVTPRPEPNFTYKLSRFLYPLIRLFGRNSSIKSTDLASAIFNVGVNGSSREIFENADIINAVRRNLF